METSLMTFTLSQKSYYSEFIEFRWRLDRNVFSFCIHIVQERKNHFLYFFLAQKQSQDLESRSSHYSAWCLNIEMILARIVIGQIKLKPWMLSVLIHRFYTSSKSYVVILSKIQQKVKKEFYWLRSFTVASDSILCKGKKVGQSSYNFSVEQTFFKIGPLLSRISHFILQ